MFFNILTGKNCSQYEKRAIPEILLSNTKESNGRNKITTNKIFNNNKSPNDANKKKNNMKKPNSSKLTKNGRCNYCGKKGHYFYECIYGKRSNKYKRKYFRKSKTNNVIKNTKITSQIIIQNQKVIAKFK